MYVLIQRQSINKQYKAFGFRRNENGWVVGLCLKLRKRQRPGPLLVAGHSPVARRGRIRRLAPVLSTAFRLRCLWLFSLLLAWEHLSRFLLCLGRLRQCRPYVARGGNLLQSLTRRKRGSGNWPARINQAPEPRVE